MSSYGTAQLSESSLQRQPTYKVTNVLETRLVRDQLATWLLSVLSVLLIACGIAVIVLQVLLNEQILHEFEMPAQYYGYVCGTVMILNGIFCTFTAAYKTYYLMITSSILAVAGYLASILSCAVSIYILNSFDDSFMAKIASLVSSTKDRAKTELIVMATLGAVSFILSMIISVVLCWAYGCSYCRPRTSSARSADRPLLDDTVQVL